MYWFEQYILSINEVYVNFFLRSIFQIKAHKNLALFLHFKFILIFVCITYYPYKLIYEHIIINKNMI